MKTQRAEVESLIDEARSKEANAAEAARMSANRAAAVLVRSALDEGAPYRAALDDLEAGGVDVSAALSGPANDGVATLATLQNGFDQVARNALSLARSNDESGGGLGGFLQRRLGARSVEPREGDDPDAVLSRAQAALMSGDLATSLSELDALPETAKPAVADWATLAQTRLDALTAIEDLVQSLNTN